MLEARLKRAGRRLYPDGLTRSWQLDLTPGVDVRTFHREQNHLVQVLNDITPNGRLVVVRRDRHYSRAVEKLTSAFPGVKYATPFTRTEGKDPVVVLVESGQTSYIGPDLVTSSVEAFSSSPEREGDRRKLSSSGTRRTHLFIWLEPQEFGLYESFCEGPLPESKPTLPNEITVVWLATHCRDGQRKVWRFDGETGVWTEVEP